MTIDILVVLVASFNIWTLRRVHRATLLGGLFLMILLRASIPIGITPAWRAFAEFAVHQWQKLV